MKKKVLLANKFYYPRGGDCVCAINLEKLLEAKGHEVAVYAMRYPENIPSRWEGYFASPVDFGGSATSKLRAAARTMGWGDIRRSFAKILADFGPDVVHLHNIHSYLSPVLAGMARRTGARVVWTLHDYKAICPSYSCLRDGRPCEECFTGKTPVVRHRCMKGSLAASVIAYVEALRWNRHALQRDIDVFVCPSSFMRDKMAQAGFDRSKLVVDCNFVGFEQMRRFRREKALGMMERGDYYCYVGRLSEEKGVESLLQAASTLAMTIKVAGDGPLLEELKARYAASPQIQFVGRLDASGVADLLRGARLSVMPSICYENNPLGVIESLCAGTPVAGARIGGIPELIDDGRTGVVFEGGDAASISRAIRRAWASDWDYDAIRAESLERFSADTHYAILDNEVYN